MATNLLSAVECKNVTSDGAGVRKLHDGDGLYLWIYRDGRKYWRMRYWQAAKEKSLSIGVYPKVTLSDARKNWANCNAVATAKGIVIRSGAVRAEGDLDFRGTLGVAKDAPVGFQRIRLYFDLESDASEDELSTLIRLTERYCVVYQTLRQPPEITVSHHVSVA